MDIYQHTWSQLGLCIMLQLLYLEISTVTCFAWHSPSQTRSQTAPVESHMVSQRWHQSVPKWYPYNMWKRRKRKEGEGSHLTLDISNVLGRSRNLFSGKRSAYVSKYRKLLDKYNRKKQMNSILSKNVWKTNAPSTTYGSSLSVNAMDNRLFSAEKFRKVSTLQTRKHKSHFGGIGSVQDSFGMVHTPKKPSTSQKKKVKELTQSGFDNVGFGTIAEDGFDLQPAGGFSNDFLPIRQTGSETLKNEADTAAKTSTGFGTGSFSSDAGSMGDTSWSDSGSWGGDGFGAVGASSAAQSSSGTWGNPAAGSDGFGTIGGGSFSAETKDCDTILTKSCSDNSECSCYGFYTCVDHRCASVQSASDSTDSAMAGTWHQTPIDFGSFSKRKDPTKVIQVFMLPWQSEK
ncbi:uncharacterized protein LOC124117376 [Haliotis rufescens]|uniref:uncharacterized protein LOC124117376 n=1 Tax=Haliotis rufescens TaxID=6454 RepID=UPI00201F6BCE|nr:uncharacterized protein LOC124117376 [Haliotis rufescens]XP_046335163.2 uncharacterized protein LOC124117376 [Haliotis rufescens]